MKPVSKATLKTVNRFPELYKRQALQVIDREQTEAIRITADSFVMATLLVLIEEFDFGTSTGATKIPRFIEALQKKIDTSAEYYDDAVAEGLHNKLAEYGVDYTMRET